VVDTVKDEVEELGDVTVTGLGLNAQVLLVGHPLTLSVTLPLKVFMGVKVIVYVAVEPSLTLVEVGEVEIEKSATSTTRVTVVECVRVPSVPVMVKVYVPPGVPLVVVTVKVEGL
jgi:hypothetical protein